MLEVQNAIVTPQTLLWRAWYFLVRRDRIRAYAKYQLYTYSTVTFCIHMIKKINTFTSLPHCLNISSMKTPDMCMFYSLEPPFPVWNSKHVGLHSSRASTPGSLWREWVTGTCWDGEVIIVTPPKSLLGELSVSLWGVTTAEPKCQISTLSHILHSQNNPFLFCI